MSGELEAAGAAITAGLAAGAIERRGGHKGHEAHGDCLNCGAALQGEYCHVCGQPSHISRTIGDVWHDFLHGVLHFDTKAWRTLPLLFFRPGTLTRRYILGERARFIGPVALFLFTVFLMFFVFAFVADDTPQVSAPQARSVAELEATVAEARAGLTEAETSLAAARAENALGIVLSGAEAGLRTAEAAVAAEERRLAEARARRDLYARAQAAVRADLEAARAANDAGEIAAQEVTLAALDQAVAGDGREVPALEITEGPGGLDVTYSRNLADPAGRESIFEEIRRAHEEGRIVVNTGIADLDKKLLAKLENPELAWYKIQNAAYKFSWLLVPISLPFVALLFLWRRGVTLFDHAVFVLYSLSFVSFVMIPIVLVPRLLPEAAAGSIAGLLLAAIPVHMFFQLKGGYALGWWSTIWRSLFLWFFAIVCLTLFFIAIVLLGLVG